MRDVDSILTSIFGLAQFRLQQREIINDVLDGRDTLVVMPTGAGKSLCYQLPAVSLRGLTLIVSPLISLMTDQVRQLRTLRIPAMMLCSGQNWDQQREVMARLRDGFRGLLYVAPERFSAPGFLSIITARQLSLFAIDEAHCISQWGHDFRPEYLRLGEVRKQLGEPLTVALTATATPEVRDDIVRSLKLREPAIHVTGFDRPNLSYQSIVFAKAKNKQEELIDYLQHQKSGGIIYCSTRKHVDAVTSLLAVRLRGRSVVAYHAGMDQEARTSNQQRFMDHEDAIVVATNAFGMGINKPNLRYVIHYNLPGSLEAYYQEAGRAGRDGLPAECILYFSVADVMTQRFFIDKIGDTNRQLTTSDIAVLQKRASKQLDAMQNYARWERCRRRQILEYFGEAKVPENCTCDVCSARKPALKLTGRAVQTAAESTATALPATRSSRAEILERAMGRAALTSEDARLQKLKDLRRDVVRALGTMFFQRLPDELLRRLIAYPPNSLEELRDDFEIHNKILEGFGTRILSLASPGHESSSKPNSNGAANTRRNDKEKTSRAKISAAREIAGGKVGALHGSAVEARFERLRTLRLELARKRGWRAFQILHDSALLEVARQQPRTIRELMEIKGIGEKKAEEFGQELLAEIERENRRE